MKHHLHHLKIAIVIFSFAGAISLVACEKKNDGGPAPVPAGYNQFGQVGVSQMQSSVFGNQGVFSLNLILNNQGMPVDFQNPYTQNNYSGSAALQGYLQINIQDFTFCYLPVGTYTVNTIQAGMMSGKVLSGIRMQATGPGGNIVMTVTSAEIYNQFSASGVRLGMNLNLESVNGMNCGLLSTY